MATAVIVRVAATDSFFTVPVSSPDMRVADLKKAIHETHAFPVKKQKLSVNGKSLKDKQKVADAFTPGEDVIDVGVAVKGGCFGCDLDCCCCDFSCCC